MSPNPKKKPWEKELELMLIRLIAGAGSKDNNTGVIIDYVKTLINKEVKRGLGRMEKVIEKTKLPYPNPYGKWVRVPRVNKILGELNQKIKKEVEGK